MKWHTTPKRYNQLVQVTDGYVVHARGFTVGDHLWLDEYATYRDHDKLWREAVAPELDLPEKLFAGSDADEGAGCLDRNLVYWSVTGSGTITLDWPRPPDDGPEERAALLDTLDALQVPPDVSVHVGRENLYRTTAGELRD